MPGGLPYFIEADITELKIGSKLYVTQLPIENVMIMHPDNTVVAQVRTSRVAIDDVEDEEDEDEEGAEGETASAEGGNTEETPASE